MRKRFPFDSIFLGGLIAGILIMNFGKSILLEDAGLLDEYTVCYMRSMTVDSSALFVYVLQKRLAGLAVLAIMSTTYLGLAFCSAAAFWYGLSAGAFLTAGVLRFGIRGILFVLAGTMPQYLVYVPAFYVLLLWCEEIYRAIYRKKNYETEQKAPATLGRMLKLLFICVAVLLGCILESFANPAVFLSFLQIL